MLDLAALALTTFVATIGPVDVAAMFAALTAHATRAERRATAIRGTALATAVLLAFALAGESVLSLLGISLAALRTAGGILLLLIGIDMVFARSSGGTSTTDEETREALEKRDITVFPLATPLIAGPGAMGAVILLMANAGDDLGARVVVVASLLTVLAVTLAALLMAGAIHRWLGVTGMHVVSRVFGVLLCALAVQFIFDGVGDSGLVRSSSDRNAPALAAPSSTDATATTAASAAMVMGRAPRASNGYSSLVVLEPLEPTEYPAPAEPALMDQSGMAFFPPVLIVRVGQPVHFRNSEDILHNVRVYHAETREPEFNVATPLGGTYEHVFGKTGTYAVSCDVHPAMTASILAVETPFAAVADPDGRFALSDVPAGRYRARVRNAGQWSEQEVEIVGPHADLVLGATAPR